jgi:hypothetical protein
MRARSRDAHWAALARPATARGATAAETLDSGGDCRCHDEERRSGGWTRLSDKWKKRRCMLTGEKSVRGKAWQRTAVLGWLRCW